MLSSNEIHFEHTKEGHEIYDLPLIITTLFNFIRSLQNKSIIILIIELEICSKNSDSS